jgi:hypothetical protein
MAEPKSDAELGDPAYGSDAGTITYEADESITAGDAVTIDSTNQLLQAANSGDTNADVVGIAADDAEDGDNVSVHVSGRIVANVASGVTAGEELDASTTDGQLATGTGGIVALTDEGGVAGLSAGFGLASNAAVVEVR